MSLAPKDPLLLAAKIATFFAQAAMVIGGLALSIGLIAIPLFRAEILAAMREEFADPSLTIPYVPIIATILIGLALVAMLFVFFGKLRQIIHTVGEGDPFVIENASRLSLMAWLMLGVQLLAIPAAATVFYLAKFADEMDGAEVHSDAGVSLSGVLMVILLFILARVFRQGAKMRDDLEGTI